MRNIRTTISGTISAVCLAVAPFVQAAEGYLTEILGVVSAASLALMAYFAKDADKQP